MLEFVFQIVGELLLQIFGELLVELGFQALSEPFRTQGNPWLAALGYALFGAMLGGLSLLAFPHLLTPASLRVANLLVTPVLAGLCMLAIGVVRSRRGDPVLRIDQFSYGYLLALAVALVRVQFAQ